MRPEEADQPLRPQKIAVATCLGKARNAAVAQDTPDVGEAAVDVGYLAEHGGDEDGIEGLLPEGKSHCVCLHEACIWPSVEPVPGKEQHLALEVEDHQLALRHGVTQ